ncbi:NAD(P)/FAD-dependent oxidoreductase [Saccharopolyspora rosea]|uniref:NAD(P)/FAD-dependent oxidoreductase n=1 Tax=Saccharopolyspora rosea TaxID=524884 RepID=A0ABW3FKC5_9PSEU|nr:FAD-dependent oxidoreductase [Saccharopolyspora rosea]
MSDVLVVGGGFAGVWSALGAARVLRGRRSVTLVAPGDDLVIRPRLYQANPQDMRVPLDRVLAPVGVRRVPATVTGVDVRRRRVTATGRDGAALDLPFQRLVLAAGSEVVRSEVPGAEHLHDVDTLESATALDRHLHALPAGPGRFTAVVVGAGFTGVEIATELVGRLREIAGPQAERVRVVLVERADVVGPELGPGPRPVIEAALDDLGVELRLGTSLESVAPDAVHLSDGSELPARTAVWTAGVRANPLTTCVPGPRDRLGRLETDEFLQVTGVSGVYAAGDTAAAPVDSEHVALPSCQHALPLGRFAGHNVAADLLGLEKVPFRPDPYVTCLDLGGAGAVFTTGWERTVRSSGEAAKERKRKVNEDWIYPPLDDPAEILRRADHRVSTRRS